MKTLQAVRGIVIGINGTLIIRESKIYQGNLAGRYDLPGGKIKPGEDPVEALKREVCEECGLDIEVGTPFFTGEWFPIVQGEKIQIIGTYYICAAVTEDVSLSSDHDHHEWIDPENYRGYDLASPNPATFNAYLELLQTQR